MKSPIFSITNDPLEELRSVATPGPGSYQEKIGRTSQIWDILAHDGKSGQTPLRIMKRVVVAATLIFNHIPEPPGANAITDNVINFSALALEDRLSRTRGDGRAHF